MKQEALQNFDMPWLPITALIIFIVCFCAYTYWAYKKDNKKMFDEAAMIPLEENYHERRN